MLQNCCSLNSSACTAKAKKQYAQLTDKLAFTMKIKHLILISIAHVFLTVFDMIIYDYQQISDSLRYILASNEFASLNFSNLSASVHCNTAPGYPIFLLIIKFITQHNKFPIAMIQSALYCVSLYFLLHNLHAKKLLTSWQFTLSYILILFSPEIFQSNQITYSESLCGSLILLISGCLVSGFANQRAQILFVLSTTFLVLCKFEYLLILPIILIALSYNRRYKLLFSTVFLLTIALTLNGLKNYAIYKVFNPSSFGSGTVIYGGNNENDDGSWHVTENNYNYLPQIQINNYKAFTALTPECRCIKQDSLFKAMAADAWKSNPLKQLKIIPTKLGKLWVMPLSLDVYTGQTEFKMGLQIKMLFDDSIWPWYGKYKHGVYLFIYWTYLFLILFGFYLKMKTEQFKAVDCFVVLLILAFSIMYGILFYGLGRFHIPIFGILTIYASFSIEYIDRKFLKQHMNKLLQQNNN